MEIFQKSYPYPAQNRPILITGCQRSGTTLLNLILNCHPEIHAIDESQYQDDRLRDYLNLPQYHPNVCFKLPTFAHGYAYFHRIQNLKVLFMVRDPRDVITSMMKLKLIHGTQKIPWAAHPHGAMREILNGLEVLAQDQKLPLACPIEKFFQIQKKDPSQWSKSDMILSGALCWAIKNSLPHAYDKVKINYQKISFANLIQNPRKTLGQILEFIQLPWHDDLLRHHQLHHGISIGNTDNQRPIDPKNSQNWLDDLNKNDLSLIQEICEPIVRNPLHVKKFPVL